jgi:hypothetical protein
MTWSHPAADSGWRASASRGLPFAPAVLWAGCVLAVVIAPFLRFFSFHVLGRPDLDENAWADGWGTSHLYELNGIVTWDTPRYGIALYVGAALLVVALVGLFVRRHSRWPRLTGLVGALYLTGVVGMVGVQIALDSAADNGGFVRTSIGPGVWITWVAGAAALTSAVLTLRQNVQPAVVDVASRTRGLVGSTDLPPVD